MIVLHALAFKNSVRVIYELFLVSVFLPHKRQRCAKLEGKKGKKAKENHSKIKPTMLSSTEVIVADSPIHTATSKVASNSKLPTNFIPKSIFNSLQSKDKSSSDEELNSEDYDQDGDDYDDEDEGTIHQIDPNVNLNTLLHSLTQKENEKTEQTNRKSTITADKTNAIKHSTDLSIEHLDGDSNLKALIPGPPRDLVAQLVNRYVTLSWMEPAKNPDEVISYTVFYKMTSSERYVFIYQQASMFSNLKKKSFFFQD